MKKSKQTKTDLSYVKTVALKISWPHAPVFKLLVYIELIYCIVLETSLRYLPSSVVKMHFRTCNMYSKCMVGYSGTTVITLGQLHGYCI